MNIVLFLLLICPIVTLFLGSLIGSYLASALALAGIFIYLVAGLAENRILIRKSAFVLALCLSCLMALVWSTLVHGSLYITSTLLALILASQSRLRFKSLYYAHLTILCSLVLCALLMLFWGTERFIEIFGKNVSGTLVAYWLLVLGTMYLQSGKSLKSIPFWMLLVCVAMLIFGVLLEGRSQILMGAVLGTYICIKAIPLPIWVKWITGVVGSLVIIFQVYSLIDISSYYELVASEPRYLLYFDFYSNFWSNLFGSGSSTEVFQIYNYNYHNAFLQFTYLGGVFGFVFSILALMAISKRMFLKIDSVLISLVLLIVFLRMNIDSVFLLGAEAYLFIYILLHFDRFREQSRKA